MISPLPCVATDIQSVFQSIAHEYTSSDLDWFNFCDKPLDREKIAALLASDLGVITASASNDEVCVEFIITPLMGFNRTKKQYLFYAVESIWHFHTETARRHLPASDTDGVLDHRFGRHLPEQLTSDEIVQRYLGTKSINEVVAVCEIIADRIDRDAICKRIADAIAITYQQTISGAG